MQLGFYFDQTKCVGCYACLMACNFTNSPPTDANWRTIDWIGSYDEPEAFVSMVCMHCAKPPCVEQCPTGAITKRVQDGIVVVDQDKCLGKDNCDMCMQACPYNVPQFGSVDNAKMSKCTFCLGRLEAGKKPFCVMMCTMEALDYGPLEELRSKYGDSTEAKGFAYDKNVEPSIIMKSK